MSKRGRPPKPSLPDDQAYNIRAWIRERVRFYDTTQAAIVPDPVTAEEVYGLDADGAADWIRNALANSRPLSREEAGLLYDIVFYSRPACEWRDAHRGERDPMFSDEATYLPWRFHVARDLPTVLIPDSEVDALANELVRVIASAQLRISDKRLEQIKAVLIQFFNENCAEMGWHLVWDLGHHMNWLAEQFRTGVQKMYRRSPGKRERRVATIKPFDLLNSAVWDQYRDRSRDEERRRRREERSAIRSEALRGRRHKPPANALGRSPHSS